MTIISQYLHVQQDVLVEIQAPGLAVVVFWLLKYKFYLSLYYT